MEAKQIKLKRLPTNGRSLSYARRSILKIEKIVNIKAIWPFYKFCMYSYCNAKTLRIIKYK